MANTVKNDNKDFDMNAMMEMFQSMRDEIANLKKD